MRPVHLLPVLLVTLVGLLPAGCGRVDAPADQPPVAVVAAARYALRSDLMAVGDLGAPPKWYSAGYPPLRTVRLDGRSPDAEFAALLRPKLGKDILDPQSGLTAGQRDDIGRFLDKYFGTPAAPTVRVPTETEALDELKLAEWADEEQVKTGLAEAAAAKSALRLDDQALARGGILYRRWCLQCHGPTGGGDGDHAVAMTAPPRDYRRGLFKFVSCFPTDVPRKGELGKARKDDIKRTVRNGLDGSMMPPFPQFSDAELDDLAGYVIHLSVRGETEFEVIARMIQLTTNPRDDDPLYSPEFAEVVLALKLLETLGNWQRADTSPIPIPPSNVSTDLDRLASAARGYRAFGGTCAGCHQDYGRAPQLKFDLWGTVVQPRNLMLGVYRGGRRGEDLYARIYGGIYASTMPDSKAKAAAPTPPGQPDGIWDLVHFLEALADPRERKHLQQYDPGITIE